MKVLIRVPVWKRPEVTKVCFDGIERIREHWKHDTEVLIIGSEGWAEELTGSYGYNWEYIENHPFGAKLNKGLAACMKYKWDYLLNLGQDNLISNKLLDIYNDFIGEFDLFGIDKCHWIQNDNVKLVDYELQMLGAGRMYRRGMLEKICCNNSYVEFLEGVAGALQTWNKGDRDYLKATEAMEWQKQKKVHIISTGHTRLWREDIERGFDNSSYMKLILHRASNKIIDIGSLPYLVDIKTNENIWKYDSLEGKAADMKDINREIPELNVFRELRRSSPVLV